MSDFATKEGDCILDSSDGSGGIQPGSEPIKLQSLFNWSE